MKLTSFIIAIFILSSCNSKQKIDLLVFNATVYTVDSNYSKAEAFAVDKGKIIEVGETEGLQKKYEAKENVDANGKFIFPGFIDGHAHFLGYGLGLQSAGLEGAKSWDELLEKLKTFASVNKEGWIIGRGWDQNDWDVKEFPANEKLNELFPDRPVVLSRVDGHASIANNKALELANIKASDKIEGGDIEVVNGKLTGILIDNAMELISSKIPASSSAQLKEALMDAQKNCFVAGLTTIDDCGLDYTEVLLIDSLQKSNELKMRLYVMLSDTKRNFDFLFSKGKIKTGRLNVRSFKVYADGALGSRGACLLEPYSDKPGWTGFLLSSAQHFDSVANIIYDHDFQMCTHAIGDSGNRVILNTYAKYLKGKNNLRWRIEHAQVVNETDFHLFGDYNIIPSVQPTHGTSDMYWAGGRLGTKRVKNAYAFNKLMKQNGWTPLGTDFPVEDISPIKTFYAAVFRKDAKGWPESGYQMENALSREEAIRGITIWAAKSNFEENEKGSIEKEKFADFILIDKDLMTTVEKDILSAKILMTFVNGERVYVNSEL